MKLGRLTKRVYAGQEQVHQPEREAKSMRDFFRIVIPHEIAAAGICTLARLTHEAEETDDDVLLMQVQGALQSRPDSERELFRQVYLEQWKIRMEARKVKP